MARRTKYEVWVEILEVCLNEPRHQTWILRELGLKTNHVKQSLSFLTRRNLLKISDDQEEDPNNAYITTEKGKEALLVFYKMITEYFKE